MGNEIIDPKRNKAKVNTETIPESEMNLYHHQVNQLIKDAGIRLCPDSYEYMGSACIHYYRHSMRDHEFLTKVQDLLGEIPEPYADFGWKQLRDRMMIHYGREPRKERK